MDIRSLVPGQTKTGLSKTTRNKSKSLASANSATSTESDDSVSITSHASSLSALIQQMKAAPALDMERVAPVKEKVDQGAYEIEYERVANKMLDFESSYYG